MKHDTAINIIIITLTRRFLQKITTIATTTTNATMTRMMAATLPGLRDDVITLLTAPSEYQTHMATVHYLNKLIILQFCINNLRQRLIQ